MSLKKVAEVKKDRGFKIWDLTIYGTVLLLAAALFIAVFATRNTDPLSGVRISVRDGVFSEYKVVFEYGFGGEPNILDTEAVETEDKDGILKVTVKTGAHGYNIIEIDKKARTATVTDANCKSRRCVYTPAITDNNRDIHGDTHGLKVEPFSFNIDNPVQPI